jgi:3-isopropylmalate dehydratase small subunit
VVLVYFWKEITEGSLIFSSLRTRQTDFVKEEWQVENASLIVAARNLHLVDGFGGST